MMSQHRAGIERGEITSLNVETVRSLHRKWPSLSGAPLVPVLASYLQRCASHSKINGRRPNPQDYCAPPNVLMTTVRQGNRGSALRYEQPSPLQACRTRCAACSIRTKCPSRVVRAVMSMMSTLWASFNLAVQRVACRTLQTASK